MNPATLKLTILRVLSGARPYALPAETLLVEVNRLTRPALTVEELRTLLRGLLDQSMIDFLPDDLDRDNEDARRWLIREAGQAQLRS
jgi:hypothetical protein